MVPNPSPLRRGLAASRPQRETPRPLPVLRTAHEPPQSLAVLSGRPPGLEEVARPEDARKDAYLGEVRAAAASPPASATPDHTSPGRSSQEPTGVIPRGGVCEGRGQPKRHGEPTRARSRKRRTQTRNAYSDLCCSLLLGQRCSDSKFGSFEAMLWSVRHAWQRRGMGRGSLDRVTRDILYRRGPAAWG